ncbi:PE-PGRS family protein, partial [Mycobacterium tuberculosis variant pinnipedii]
DGGNGANGSVFTNNGIGGNGGNGGTGANAGSPGTGGAGGLLLGQNGLNGLP